MYWKKEMKVLASDLESLNAMGAEAWQAVIRMPAQDGARWMGHAATLGHPNAQAIWGQWLLDGHGTARDAAQALRWFLRAAQQGHVLAINMTGRCYENGWGTAPDMFAAGNWYRQAAKKGLDAGMYNYANLLTSGKGVRKDLSAALQWYERAAAMGHAKSMTKLGFFYEDGKVVPKDLDMAFRCFEGGALGGDFRGQFNYAGMLAARGRLKEALHWLKQVPGTATPGFKCLAGRQLLDSSYPEFRAVGQEMLADAG